MWPRKTVIECLSMLPLFAFIFTAGASVHADIITALHDGFVYLVCMLGVSLVLLLLGKE
jgi:hypothetical protein